MYDLSVSESEGLPVHVPLISFFSVFMDQDEVTLLPAVPVVKIFDGECSSGTDIQMYEGNSDNDGTTEQKVTRCSNACQSQKTPLSGSWSDFEAKGFVVASSGRCYCENAASATCTRATNSYGRYDWEPGAPVHSYTARLLMSTVHRAVRCETQRHQHCTLCYSCSQGEGMPLAVTSPVHATRVQCHAISQRAPHIIPACGPSRIMAARGTSHSMPARSSPAAAQLSEHITS